MGYITPHDQPGTMMVARYFPGVGAKANGGPVVAFVAPFKCVLGSVIYRGSANWAPGDDTNYCNLILYNMGTNGTATASALGTICGSPAIGTISAANIGTALYAGGTTQYAEKTVFVGSVGTIGAGSVAVAGGEFEAYFKAV